MANIPFVAIDGVLQGVGAGGGGFNNATLTGITTVAGTLAMGANPITFTDSALIRDAANVLAQRNGVNAQNQRIYNTFASGANDEWLEFNWQASAGVAVIRTATTGGTARNLQFRYGNTAVAAFVIPVASTTQIDIASNVSQTSTTNGQVAISRATTWTTTTGTSYALGVAVGGGPAPTLTSTLAWYGLNISPVVNYSAATPGAGSYEALHIGVTETALPTGQNYFLRCQGGAAGATDRYAIDNTGGQYQLTANGAQMFCGQVSAQTGALSGAAVNLTSLIPAGAFVLGVTVRVTTAITGATSFSVGDGVTATRWGTTVGIALGTTTSGTNFAATSPSYFPTATNVVLTANGGSFTGGVVRATVHYLTFGGPTS